MATGTQPQFVTINGQQLQVSCGLQGQQILAVQDGPGQPQQYFSLPPDQMQQLIIHRPQSFVPARFPPRPAEQEGRERDSAPPTTGRESVPLVRDGEQQAEQPQALPHPSVIQQNYLLGPSYPTTIQGSNPYQQDTRGHTQPYTGYSPKPQGSAPPYTEPAPGFNSIPGAVYNQFASTNHLPTFPSGPMCSTPDIRANLDREDIQQAREQDRMEKARQEMYEDNKEGDTIA